MISVKTALEIIEKAVQVNSPVERPLQDCFGHILAEDVLSPINMPPFRQSSMDGYALRWSNEVEYTLSGEVKAGASTNLSVKQKEAIRIFTGARVPDEADTVVMQEHITATKGMIKVEKMPQKGANVRPLGEQLKKDAVALKKGTYLNPAAVGFLTGIGIESLQVYPQPKVSILVTGNELKQPGTSLAEGEIYESNGITLKLALQELGIKEIALEQVEDDLQQTTATIKKHLSTSDVLIISGGISVGDYDFVQAALLKNEVEEHFYKVNQKPGKPLWFGTQANKTVFALPGNPASSLTCFYIYVLPALHKLMGYENIHLARKQALLSDDIQNNTGKTRFLKGIVHNNTAAPLMGQASSMLKSFAIANALLMVPSEIELIKKGESITYIDLKS